MQQRANSHFNQLHRISTESKDGDVLNEQSVDEINKSSEILQFSKKEEYNQPLNVIFLEDGTDLKNGKSLRVDINKYKAKYYIEPPKYIS